MTPQEMDRKMEFIIEHQAQFAVRIDKLTQSQATLTASVLRIAEIVEDLAEAQKRTDEKLARTDEQLARTDDRLNILINIVEKHITGPDHGRKPQ